MIRKYKAKGNYVIIKKYVEENVTQFDFGAEEEISKIDYLEGYITDIGKNVDKEEFKVGMLVRCELFTAGLLDEGEHYHVHVKDIACEIELIEE